MDQVSIVSLPPSVLFGDGKAEKSPGSSAAASRSPVQEVALRIALEQLSIRALPGDESEQEERLASVTSILPNILAALGDDKLTQNFAAACEENTPASLVAFINSWVTGSNAEDAEHPQKNGRDPKNLDATSNASVLAFSEAESPRSNGAAHKTQVLKVDTLMNLIGELVISKNGLPFLARRAEEIYGSREMSREIKEQYGVIDRLAQEMQTAIMTVRMQPISEAFDRFPRLVRDLARKLSKKIDLRMEDEETAADKAIIAALGEPLLHIVRNSIDHGIEAPEERIAVGKSSQAHILLRAYQESDQIVIEVIDDGRGIDPAKIKAAALSKGVITEDQAARLSDQEAINLIFQPGFSTAAEVSDLSGRQEPSGLKTSQTRFPKRVWGNIQAFALQTQCRPLAIGLSQCSHIGRS